MDEQRPQEETPRRRTGQMIRRAAGRGAAGLAKMILQPLITAVIILPLFAGTLFLAKPMQAFFLGEAVASSLGVNVRRFRLALILIASLLAATVTAFAGPISFVGIAVPFLIRRLLGTEQTRITIPVTFFGGGVFCLLADLLARNLLAPTELSISVVTSILGAPVVIVMLILMQRRKAGGAA